MVSMITSYLIGIFCVLAWGWWLCRRMHLSDGFAPALGLGSAIAVLAAAGCCGLLSLGAQAFILGAVLVTVRPKRGLTRGFLLSPGVCAFITGCAVLALLTLFTATAGAASGNIHMEGYFLFSGDSLSALDFLFAIWTPGENSRSILFTTALPPLAALSAVIARFFFTKASRTVRLLLAGFCGAGLAALMFFAVTGKAVSLPVAAVCIGLSCLLFILNPASADDPLPALHRAQGVGILCSCLVVLGYAGRGAAILMLFLWLVRSISSGLRGKELIRAFAAALLPPVFLTLWCLWLPMIVLALGI